MDANPETALLDPTKVPLPVKTKHPLRYGVLGAEHTREELLKTIADHPDMHAGLKSFISDELAKAGSDAAVLDLHVVDLPNGDMAFHGHLKHRRFGSGAKHPGAS